MSCRSSSWWKNVDNQWWHGRGGLSCALDAHCGANAQSEILEHFVALKLRLGKGAKGGTQEWRLSASAPSGFTLNTLDSQNEHNNTHCVKNRNVHNHWKSSLLLLCPELTEQPRQCNRQKHLKRMTKMATMRIGKLKLSFVNLQKKLKQLLWSVQWLFLFWPITVNF